MENIDSSDECPKYILDIRDAVENMARCDIQFDDATFFCEAFGTNKMFMSFDCTEMHDDQTKYGHINIIVCVVPSAPPLRFQHKSHINRPCSGDDSMDVLLLKPRLYYSKQYTEEIVMQMGDVIILHPSLKCEIDITSDWGLFFVCREAQ